jgi:hypothetical protein
MPTHPDVQAFLRGPSETYTVYGLNGIGHARNFVGRYCSGTITSTGSTSGYSGSGSRSGSGFSVRGVAGGIGQKAYVQLTKTKACYQSLLKAYEDDQREKTMVMELLAASGSCPAGADAGAGAGGAIIAIAGAASTATAGAIAGAIDGAVPATISVTATSTSASASSLSAILKHNKENNRNCNDDNDDDDDDVVIVAVKKQRTAASDNSLGIDLTL